MFVCRFWFFALGSLPKNPKTLKRKGSGKDFDPKIKNSLGNPRGVYHMGREIQDNESFLDFLFVLGFSVWYEETNIKSQKLLCISGDDSLTFF